jgi:hypothetical protein
MAHFAKLGPGNIVEEVVVVNNNILLDSDNNEQEQLGIDFLKGLHGNNTTWVQCSYNDKTFRGGYPGKGYTYSQDINKFISSRPYNNNGVFKSWTLNSSTGKWDPPIAKPTDGNEYAWDDKIYWEDTSDPKTAGWIQIDNI